MLVIKVRLIAVIMAALPAAAHGQIICANCYDQPTGLVADITTAAHWVSQLAQMRQHYTQLVATYGTLAHLNPQTLQTGAGLLNNGVRLPGSAAGIMPGLNFGNNLSGPGQQFYDRNHVYTPDGTDFAATEIQRRQIATANLQAEAQTGVERAEQRLASLTELETSLPDQDDVTAVAAMHARINAEHVFLANETNHIAMLQMLQQIQNSVDVQRSEQHGRQQVEEWGNAVAAQAWGG